MVLETKEQLANEIDRVNKALLKSDSAKCTRDLKKYLRKLQSLYGKYRWG